MGDLLFTIAAFAVAIGVLVTVHEYGHFRVARWAGVRVLRFSVGMGRPLLRRSGRDGTEYVLAALPIGGYVKMLDEREGEVDPTERHRAFNNRPLGWRTAVVLAGPVANFLFAIAAYWLMLVMGVPGLQAAVEGVEPDSAAARAGIAPGDAIVAVDGRPAATWGAAMQALLPAALDGESVGVTLRRDGREETVTLEVPRMPEAARGGDLGGRLGMTPARPAIPPILGQVESGSPADRAGLEAGDRIVALAGEPVNGWRELVERVRGSPGEPLSLTVEDGGGERQVTVTPEEASGPDGESQGRIGAGVEPPGELPAEYRAVQRFGPVAALGEGVTRTWETATMTLKVLGRMVIGQASLENLSGPVTIAQFAGHTADAGFVQFIAFLAVVSISLGVINLLPVPLLDGGHLLYYGIELLKGSPVSEQTEALGQRIGLAAILALMGLAFFNDLSRLFS
ncbi:RIP metalloprotease RseP [Thiohalospira sp.]|uniref:RIP metalloprotease RseP n=1 Tax=Thiohalospira sp. TaxID=3080549 RepID=UPI00397F83EC